VFDGDGQGGAGGALDGEGWDGEDGGWPDHRTAVGGLHRRPPTTRAIQVMAESGARMTSIAILEDNDRRRAEMLAVLREVYPDVDFTTHRDAPGFIALTRLEELDLICLDHDLEPPADDPGGDMGDGRDVVRWLLSQPHKVPVLLHTTNGRHGSEMENLLQEAGWEVEWVPPYEDLVWVRKSWIKRVGKMLGRNPA
jgi:CheY-like chemotaxis protein